jgi:expansin (peptidoglycan-binding protein)
MFGGGYPGPNCFKQLQITANGKSAVATVMDQCPGCAYGDLDMSPSLFSHFADHSVGRFGISWDWIDGSSSPAPAPVVVSLKCALKSQPQN